MIIGHSQLEKIPLSAERQAAMLQRQIDEITTQLGLMDRDTPRFTVKQMERTRKGLETRLERLNDDSRKDDVVTFEELGIDRLFIDEAHNFKNLFLYTKLRNVAGVAQTEAKKSSDLFAKCQYLDELTGGRGVVFATGTPISNSMAELYTMMRYLQYGMLQDRGLTLFDEWASTFGEVTTSVELKPEGTGYRMRTAVFPVLQFAGADGAVARGGGHPDSGYAEFVCAGGGAEKCCGKAHRHPAGNGG